VDKDVRGWEKTSKRIKKKHLKLMGVWGANYGHGKRDARKSEKSSTNVNGGKCTKTRGQ